MSFEVIGGLSGEPCFHSYRNSYRYYFHLDNEYHFVMVVLEFNLSVVKG